jgi:hypothetical protein
MLDLSDHSLHLHNRTVILLVSIALAEVKHWGLYKTNRLGCGTKQTSHYRIALTHSTIMKVWLLAYDPDMLERHPTRTTTILKMNPELALVL